MKTTGRIGILVSLCMLLGSMATPRLLAQNIQVTSANPPAAPQGTINLNVAVGGSGFKKGAKAAFFLSGTTNPDGVTVNSTSFNSSSQVTANITISDTTSIADFDIQVTNSDGRTGKGSHLFAVTAQGTSTCQAFSVTSIFADVDSNSVPLQLPSDGLGPYVTYANKKDQVNSRIQGSCNWMLDLSTSLSRTVKLSLRYAGSNGAQLPTGWPTDGSAVNVAARIESTCQDNPVNNGLSYGTMTYAGQTLQCPLAVSFYFNGTAYGIRMAPQNYAGATWAQATCTGATSGHCNQWTVTPIPNAAVNPEGQPVGVGELIQPPYLTYATGTPLGLYYVSFSVTIHE